MLRYQVFAEFYPVYVYPLHWFDCVDGLLCCFCTLVDFVSLLATLGLRR